MGDTVYADSPNCHFFSALNNTNKFSEADFT